MTTTAIKPEDVKRLRDQTGAGIMDCKRALEESGGDVDGAIRWLREKGLSAAAKKAGRVAREGVIASPAPWLAWSTPRRSGSGPIRGASGRRPTAGPDPP